MKEACPTVVAANDALRFSVWAVNPFVEQATPTVANPRGESSPPSVGRTRMRSRGGGTGPPPEAVVHRESDFAAPWAAAMEGPLKPRPPAMGGKPLSSCSTIIVVCRYGFTGFQSRPLPSPSKARGSANNRFDGDGPRQRGDPSTHGDRQMGFPNQKCGH